MIELFYDIGFIAGSAVVPGLVAFVATRMVLVLRARYLMWRQRPSDDLADTVEVHAKDVQFWLEARESGTPGEQAVAEQMLQFLGYVEPARVKAAEVVQVPRETERDRAIRYADQRAQTATNQEARDGWIAKAAKLRAERDQERGRLYPTAYLPDGRLRPFTPMPPLRPMIKRREIAEHADIREVSSALQRAGFKLYRAIVKDGRIELNNGGFLRASCDTDYATGTLQYVLEDPWTGMAIRGVMHR